MTQADELKPAQESPSIQEGFSGEEPIVPDEEEPKNIGGRPLKFQSVEELQKKIDEYFEWCEAHIAVKKNLFYDEQLEAYPEKIREWESTDWQSEEHREANKPPIPVKEERWQTSSRPLITDLALWLECDIETIKNYSQRDGFSRPIKEAYLKVQRAYEEKLGGTTPTGSMFALKNFGWSDKTEMEVRTGEIDNLLTKVDGKGDSL